MRVACFTTIRIRLSTQRTLALRYTFHGQSDIGVISTAPLTHSGAVLMHS